MRIQSLEEYMNRNPVLKGNELYQSNDGSVLVYRSREENNVHKRIKIADLKDFPENAGVATDAFYNGKGRFEVVGNNSYEFEFEEEEQGKLRRSFCEARILEMMNGTPSIVPFRGYTLALDSRGSLYSILQTRNVRGEALGKLVRKDKGEKLSLVEGIKVIADIAAALYEVHDKNIIHRDVKPANIHFSREEHMATLLDFGIAFPLSRLPFKESIVSDLTTLLEEVADVDEGGKKRPGSPSYLSPEQAQGRNIQKIDIFALGLVGYFMFTGEHAFSVPELGIGDQEMERYLLERINYIQSDVPRANIMKKLATLSRERFSRKLPTSIIDAIEQALDRNPDKRSLYPLDDATQEYLAEFVDTDVIKTLPPPLPTEEDTAEMDAGITNISTADIISEKDVLEEVI